MRHAGQGRCRHTAWMSPLGAALVALTVATLAAACGPSGSEPIPGANSGAASSSTAGATPTATNSASATASGQHPDPSVPVEWGNGRDTPGMKAGVPDPPGWYDHAFGGPTEEQVIYLTFDDGPLEPYTGELLRLLDKHRAKATFFVTGVQARANPASLRALVNKGHALGNHTWDHPDLVALPEPRVRAALESVIRQVGPSLGPCMRPPYGLIDNKVAAVTVSLGEIPIMWTGQAGDWDNPDPNRIVEDMKKATRPGAVLLLHDGGGSRANTVTAVSRLLPWWQQQGYRLETVPACRRSSDGE